MDIDGWLRGIGLEQYAQTFRDNAIDADVLRDLTDEHLRELGLPLGARLKLLRAVAALSAGEQTPASPEVTPPAPRTDAERRQVTVMFSDLVGSTALSARMDPEDLREVISAYQKCVAETVRRFGGFVAKYMGDGVLVYFGYPQAHEDDAERAVRAGLELIAAVAGAQDARFAANPCRHSNRARCRRRPDRRGRGAGARHRRRDAEPRGAPARDRRAEHGGHRRGHAKTSRQSVRAGRPRGKGPQGHRRAGAGLGGAAGEFGGRPVRGAARQRADGARRAGRRTRIAAAALVQSKDRRRPGGAPFRRGRYRQIAAHGRVAGTPRQRAAHALALFLLAAAHRQRVLSDHQPDGTSRRTGARRHTASKARQARCGAGADLDVRSRTPRSLPRCCRCRTTAAIPRSTCPATAPAEDAGSAQCATRGDWHVRHRC